MKKITFAFAFLIAFSLSSFGQFNPVQNVAYSQSYVYMHNFFQLTWDEPAQPHNELLGYNIYRNDELYRFQTETSLYNTYADFYGYVSNCSEAFLQYNNENLPYTDGFEIHVTAVYNPGPVESDYNQTYHANPLALAVASYTQEKAILYPNPTSGSLTIGNQNLTSILIYDSTGKKIKEFGPQAQIDLAGFAKGIYLIKLVSDKGILVDKIVVD